MNIEDEEVIALFRSMIDACNGISAECAERINAAPQLRELDNMLGRMCLLGPRCESLAEEYARVARANGLNITFNSGGDC